MKIQLLRKREDFGLIFLDSIANFFKQRFPESDYVRSNYIVNDRLNIVYPSQIDRSHLADLTSEFKYHKNMVRRFLQKVYIILAIRKPFEKIACSQKIVILMTPGTSGRWIFIPGNHSIRIVDLEKNSCFVLLKLGFNASFIATDASVRAINPWLRAPKIKLQGKGWFEEQKVVGLPWNRLPSEKRKKEVLIDAQKNLAKLYERTLVHVPLGEYTNKLCTNILDLVNDAFSSLTKSDLFFIRTFVHQMESSVLEFDPTKVIDVVTTHGDFQPANILCSDNDFWIIDWEYSDKRSVFYDALVFDLDCRSPSGLSRRVDNKIKDICANDGYLGWTGQSMDTEKYHYLFIFVLEELFVRLNEMSAESIKNKSQSLATFLFEFKIIGRLLLTSKIISYEKTNKISIS